MTWLLVYIKHFGENKPTHAAINVLFSFCRALKAIKARIPLTSCQWYFWLADASSENGQQGRYALRVMYACTVMYSLEKKITTTKRLQYSC